MYGLRRTTNGANYTYQLHTNGMVLCERVTKRDYIACTADGEQWFAERDNAQMAERRHMVIYLN